MRGISWPAEKLLVSQEGLCSMELVNYSVSNFYDVGNLTRWTPCVSNKMWQFCFCNVMRTWTTLAAVSKDVPFIPLPLPVDNTGWMVSRPVPIYRPLQQLAVLNPTGCCSAVTIRLAVHPLWLPHKGTNRPPKWFHSGGEEKYQTRSVWKCA
jgi:hypothetical protein